MYSKLTNEMVKVTDGQWHDITLVISSSANILSVDGQSVSMNSTELPDFLDLFKVSGLVVAENYEGENFLISVINLERLVKLKYMHSE